LLEKAMKGNTIVYLGTGSGKTFIAVMLIKEMREQLKTKKKAIFLVNSVALVDQQAEAIRISTGLSVSNQHCNNSKLWAQFK
jgi:endoribonuclease Dicer